MSFIPGADEAKPRLRCSRRPSALPALCLRSTCPQFAPRLGTAAVSRRGAEGGDAAAPNLVLRMAGTGPTPPSLCQSLSLGLSDCPTAGVYTVNACQPARRLQHRARQVPPLQSACVRRYVYRHCFWVRGLVSNHRQKVVLSIPWDMVCPYHRDQAGPHGTLSLPRRPCDDRSLLTLAPAL